MTDEKGTRKTALHVCLSCGGILSPIGKALAKLFVSGLDWSKKGKMSQVKLHLGSAKRRLKGFVNIDREFSEGIDLVADVSDLSAFRSSTVDEIYTSHTLEYFDRQEVRDVLLEWKRVLVPGGQLFVSVPDFAKLIEIYKNSGEIEKILGPLFGRWRNERNGETLYHKTVWDFNSLKNCLEECGYVRIDRFDPISYLSSIDEGFDDYSLAFYPHMNRDGIQLSLCISAATEAD